MSAGSSAVGTAATPAVSRWQSAAHACRAGPDSRSCTGDGAWSAKSGDACSRGAVGVHDPFLAVQHAGCEIAVVPSSARTNVHRAPDGVTERTRTRCRKHPAVTSNHEWRAPAVTWTPRRRSRSPSLRSTSGPAEHRGAHRGHAEVRAFVRGPARHDVLRHSSNGTPGRVVFCTMDGGAFTSESLDTGSHGRSASSSGSVPEQISPPKRAFSDANDIRGKSAAKRRKRMDRPTVPLLA